MLVLLLLLKIGNPSCLQGGRPFSPGIVLSDIFLLGCPSGVLVGSLGKKTGRGQEKNTKRTRRELNKDGKRAMTGKGQKDNKKKTRKGQEEDRKRIRKREERDR